MKKIIVLFCLICLPLQAAFLPPIYMEEISGTLSQTLNESTAVLNDGFNTLTFEITVPTGGEITFEGLVGTIWEPMSIRSFDEDVWRSMISANGKYIGSVAGLAQFRLKTTTGGSADGSFEGVLSREVSIMEGMEFGPPPHKFGYTPIHVDASYATTQTATVIFASDADKKSVVTDFYIFVSGSTDCELKIFDETDTSGNYLFKASIEVATNKNFVFGHSFVTPYIASAVGNSWKITTDAACDVDLIGHGYQF